MTSNEQGGSTRKRDVLVVRGGVLRAPDQEPVQIADSPVDIGRDPQCGLTLDDPEVSAIHCEVCAEAEGVLIRDLGSKNGTFVNGVRIREAWLTAQCIIGVGRSTVKFDVLGREHVELHATERFGPLIGASPRMRRVFVLLRELASTELSVLLTGETGTGKELAAQAIHEVSPRAKQPFVVLDCSTIPASLAESELFGHERGAFSGAIERTSGAFQRAHGGTLFLDEIGELPLETQPKLLRVLAERKVKRVGGASYEDVDVRFLAATHRDLERAMNAGSFRSDLYFRVAQMKVSLPPLRERREDIPLIAKTICEHLKKGERVDEIVQLLKTELAQRHWPGNVRELVSVVQAAAALPPGAESLGIVLRQDGTHETEAPTTEFGKAKSNAIDAFERDYFTTLRSACGGNVSEMARRSGLGRDKVRAYLRKHAIAKVP